jgi:exodeoxyribonuclease-3
MPKIISANLNGIRSAAKRLFQLDGHAGRRFRLRAGTEGASADMTPEFLNPHGYHGHFHYAEKKAIPARACTARWNRTRGIGFGSPNSMPKAATCAAISAT